MNTLNDSELSILNASVEQLTHFITAAHQTLNANLVSGYVEMLAEAPAPAGAPSTTDLNDILNNVVAAPGTTSIATVPNKPDTNMYQMLSQVQTLDSYISLLTAFSIYNEHAARLIPFAPGTRDVVTGGPIAGSWVSPPVPGTVENTTMNPGLVANDVTAINSTIQTLLAKRRMKSIN